MYSYLVTCMHEHWHLAQNLQLVFVLFCCMLIPFHYTCQSIYQNVKTLKHVYFIFISQYILHSMIPSQSRII